MKKYYELMKPGIIFGNAVTAAGGFLLASQACCNFPLFIYTLIGISLVIGSACVFNNYIDRALDAKMTRTQNRALVKGTISTPIACLFGSLVGFLGVLLLLLTTNLLTASIATFGFFMYVVVYAIMKRASSLGTVVGSISGAVPPVVGYTAVSGQLDVGALLIFLIVVFWQMPHFYAIAMYRLTDYTAAGLPVLPVVKGNFTTKMHILVYTILFCLVAPLPTFFGYTGYVYLVGAVMLSLYWLWISIQGFSAKNDKLWARKMFLSSLIVITLLCALIPIPF